MSSVEDLIAKLADEIRRQKVGKQALNISARLNFIELLSEEARLIDILAADKHHPKRVECMLLADYGYTAQQPPATFLADAAKVGFIEI